MMNEKQMRELEKSGHAKYFGRASIQRHNPDGLIKISNNIYGLKHSNNRISEQHSTHKIGDEIDGAVLTECKSGDSGYNWVFLLSDNVIPESSTTNAEIAVFCESGGWSKLDNRARYECIKRIGEIEISKRTGKKCSLDLAWEGVASNGDSYETAYCDDLDEYDMELLSNFFCNSINSADTENAITFFTDTCSDEDLDDILSS